MLSEITARVNFSPFSAEFFSALTEIQPGPHLKFLTHALFTVKPIVHDLQTVYEEILQYSSTAVVSEQNRTGFANSTQPVSVTVINFFLCYQYFCLYLRGKSWKVSWTRRGCCHLCDVHCSTEAESLFLTLETAVEKAISKQGPFSSCSGSFNHFTSSSSGDRMGFWTCLTMSFSSGGQSA